ncbi:unnamed protein product, partial [marine sediment metagenome]
NYFSENNDDIDKYIDDLVLKINNEKDLYVLDSRMAWHFINESFKIHLTVNPIVAAKRVVSDNHRDNEPIVKDIYEKSLNLLERRAAEDKRFNDKYGVDCSDLSNFDLVIDSTISSIEEISKLIFHLYTEFSNKAAVNKYWVSPMSLYPTEHVRTLERDETKRIKQSISKNGFYRSNVIEIVKFGTDLFIWDGHKRTSTAIFNKISLIPIDILAKDDDEIHSGNVVSHFIAATFNLSWLYDWEDVHGFMFESYPKVKQNS